MLYNEKQVKEIVGAYALVREIYGHVLPDPFSRKTVEEARTTVENFFRVVPKDLVKVIGSLYNGELNELIRTANRSLEKTIG